MKGMTLKQIYRYQFMQACEALHACNVVEQPGEFVRLSVLVHALKGQVPKYLWRLARQKEAA